METGLKEAKLLEHQNAKTSGLAVQVTPDTPVKEDEKIVNPKKLKLTDKQKASMKKINDYLDTLKSERENTELDVEVTHDFDVMKNLTQIISESNNFVVVESALIELEYLVHQIDNGFDFEQLNGFEIVLGLIDSGLDNKIVQKSARVISAATQANSRARIAVHKIHGVRRLLQAIVSSADSGATKSLIGSLSALIRDFPAAQTDFINLNGPKLLTGLSEPSLNVKILSLFSDLLNERENLPKNPQTEHEEKIVKSYGLATLYLDDVCDLIQSIEDFNSHNLNIAVVDLVQRLKCFQPKIQDKILLLHNQYNDLCSEDIAQGESRVESYFCEIHSTVQQLIDKMPLLHNEL